MIYALVLQFTDFSAILFGMKSSCSHFVSLLDCMIAGELCEKLIVHVCDRTMMRQCGEQLVCVEKESEHKQSPPQGAKGEYQAFVG